MRRLNHVAGEIVVRHYVASDGGYSDGASLYAELVNRFGDEAVDYTVSAAGAIMQRCIGKCVRFIEYYHQLSPPLISFSFASTSSDDGIIPPARLQRYTGRLHAEARRTSSIICPMESSTDRKALTFDADAAIGAFGNGHSGIGRIMPTLIPCSLAAITADVYKRQVLLPIVSDEHHAVLVSRIQECLLPVLRLPLEKSVDLLHMHRAPYAHGNAAVDIPVSYTHLDVYKRQHRPR